MNRRLPGFAPLSALALALALAAAPLGAAPSRDGDAAPLVFEVISSGLESRSAEDPEAAAEAMLRVDHGLIQRDPDAVSVPLPGGGVAVARRSWWNWISADEYHWFGDLDGAAGSVAFHYYEGRLFGSLFTAGAEYRLEPEDGLHRLVRAETPFGSCGLDHLDAAGAAPGVIGQGVRSIGAFASSDTDCWDPLLYTGIDVMVLYPLTLQSSAQAVADYAVAQIATANLLFNKSGVRIHYTLVYVGPITGEQPPGPALSGGTEATEPALDWLNEQFDIPTVQTEVELLRKAYGADMISIVVPIHSNANCGIANQVEKRNGQETMNDSTQLFGTRAFTAVELNCGNGDFTFAHELGHNYGMRHDDERSSFNILDWAYGYIIPLPTGSRATVMACVPGAAGCRRIEHFSNPGITFGGMPTGLHSSQSSTPAHDACVANLRAASYALFAKRPMTSAPSLTITSPAEGAVVQAGVAFTLAASASDANDGNLASQVQWTSSRDGFLGSGSPRSMILTTKGPHMITAKVTDSTGTTVPYSIRIVVQDLDPPRRWIDYPSHLQPISGLFEVQGWATDASGVTSVTVKLDGAPITLGSFFYGRPRYDVCAVHGDLKDPNCPNVGFNGFLDTANLANGPHTLTITVRDVYNNTTTLSRTFRRATRASFLPIADAWVSESDPNSNFGGDTNLQFRASGSGLAKHTYMKFQVSGITRPVLSAKLRMRTQTAAFGALYLYWITDTSWQESTINWTNGPLDHSDFLQYGVQPSNTYVEIDVTQIVHNDGTYTFGMTAPDVPGLAVYSREAHHTQWPSLVVLY